MPRVQPHQTEENPAEGTDETVEQLLHHVVVELLLGEVTGEGGLPARLGLQRYTQPASLPSANSKL